METVPLRGVRALTFAVVATLAAATLHAVAGGALPSPVVIGASIAMVGAVAGVLAGRSRSALQIGGGLLAAQAFLHGVFAATCDLGAQAPEMAAHAAHGSATAPPSASMLLAHVVAAAVAGWWLGWGERRIWASARRVTTWIRRRLEKPRVSVARLRVLSSPFPDRLDRVVGRVRPVVDGASRRGPPLAVLTG